MIKLSETRTKQNKKGEEIDISIYLVRINDNNLAIVEGTKVLNYFGCVRTALKRSLDYVIKGSSEELSLEFIIQAIHSMDIKINELHRSCIEKN